MYGRLECTDGTSMMDEQLISGLFECIEMLLALLRETHNAQKAQEIYDEFFGK